MMPWQKRARMVVAGIGLASAAAVYFAFESRTPAPGNRPGPQLPPGVVAEGTGVERQQGAGSGQRPVIQSARMRTFEDGSTQLEEVRIEDINRQGRAFVVTAREGRSTKDQSELELVHDIALRESDGFELRSEHGVYNKDARAVRAEGQVSFLKGSMRGSGRGMTYDEVLDVLRIDRDARVEVAPGDESSSMFFSAETASLDRRQHLLILERAVHVEHGAEIIDADRAVARLSEGDDKVQFVELRGNARIAGGTGAGFETMRAGAIDLDYAEDGVTLERARLAGAGSIVLGGEDAPGQELTGEVLDAELRADGSIGRVTGGGQVGMNLPGGKGQPRRLITSDALEAGGDGGALNTATFTGSVRFEEESGDPPGRAATSRALTVQMAEGEVTSAVFSEDVTFEEGDLRASSRTATYAPSEGALRLRGSDHRGRPRVADDRVTIEASEIDVGLDGRRVEGRERVEVALRSGRSPRSGTPGRLPGLLKQNEQAMVVSRQVVYAGSTGAAVFSGGARLWQGSTEVRGGEIEIRQESGDLIARMDARTLLALDAEPSEGEADEIRYTESERSIVYVTHRDQAAKEGQTRTARVRGTAGDLRAERIEVRLASDEGRVESVEASGSVRALVDSRTVTGDALSYRAAGETYHVTAARDHVVTVEEACRVATGRALTFSRSADTMVIDGRTEFRARTARRSECEPPSR